MKHILSRRHVVEPSVQTFKVVQKFVQRLKYFLLIFMLFNYLWYYN